MTNQSTSQSSFLTGAAVGFLFSVVASFCTLWFQHHFSKKEREIQLFLDEKKVFVDACGEYLNRFRDWHELMNDYVYNDSPSFISEFDSTSAAETYKRWAKEMDFAYGRIYLISDNDFGIITMEVSTVLTSSIRDVITSAELTTSEKEKIKSEVEDYFFKTWLNRAKDEIFRYNTGQRLQKTIGEFQQERLEVQREQKELDDAINAEYEGLKRANEFLRKKDSLAGKNDSFWQKRMPTREQFDELMRPKDK